MPDSPHIPHALGRDLPLWKGLIASVIVHALAALLLGAMPRTPPSTLAADAFFEELPALVTLEPPPEAPQDERTPLPDPPKPDPATQLAQQTPPPPPLPTPPPTPKEPEPKRVRLGSPTSPSEAATMTWLGFDEFIAHGGTPSEVDQAQFTMEAPGPRAALPSLGANTPTGALPKPVSITSTPNTAAPSSPPLSNPDETPTIIADESRRPREAEPPARTSATAPTTPPSQPELARTSESDPGEPRERITPAAPAPASLPKAITPQDKEEISHPGTGDTPAEPTITPRKPVPGAPESPEFPTGEKAIKPPDDPTTEIGPQRDGVQAASPPAPKPASEKPEATEAPAPEPKPTKLPESSETQGPRPDPTSEANTETPKSPQPKIGESQQPPAQTPSTPTPPGLPVPQRTGTGSEGRGILSDRESLASAIKKAVVVEKWGQPLVAKGLRIRTVRPKFSKYTEITSRGSPVVRILFDRSGKAREVILLSSSGVQDVDRPVMDAAYQWTATGKELEELRENPPETVAIDVRVIR